MLRNEKQTTSLVPVPDQIWQHLLKRHESDKMDVSSGVTVPFVLIIFALGYTSQKSGRLLTSCLTVVCRPGRICIAAKRCAVRGVKYWSLLPKFPHPSVSLTLASPQGVTRRSRSLKLICRELRSNDFFSFFFTDNRSISIDKVLQWNT